MSVLAVDVGGTFTDIVSWDGTSVTAAKVATTPNPADAIEGAVEPEHERLLHGTTVATNTLLERTGAVTALITSSGFEDVIEIGRQDRPSLYDTAMDRVTPLVPRDARFAESSLARLNAMAPEAVAVALIDAHLDDSRERAVAGHVRSLLGDVPISLSSAVSGEMREFERTSTTVMNAYLTGAVRDYLLALSQRMEAVSIMRSSGGLMAASQAADLPAAIVLSGPAGGAVAAGALATAMGRDSIISFDMGGTSTDVSRIENGRPQIEYERSIDGYVNRMAAVAIHAVGAGGGSIAWRDDGGALRVGPSSAGASPGPACYGSGGRAPTVTDANATLGRLPMRLGGYLVLDLDAAASALDTLDMGDPRIAAEGVVAIVEEGMAQAIRAVTIEEGVDPRGATLVAFGGAGGLHATALARSLDMASVLVPPLPGVFSALGLLLSPARADAVVATSPDAGEEALRMAASRAETLARRDLAAMAHGDTTVAVYVDMRYRGQSHELTVPLSATWVETVEAFHEAHRIRNRFALPTESVEVVAVRAEATSPSAATLADLTMTPEDGAPERGMIEIVEGASSVEASLLWRPCLRREVVGPAIIAEPSCTTLVSSGERAIVHDNGALELQW